MEEKEEKVDVYLAHYGVPGMKWGRRKARETKGDRRAANRKTLSDFGERRLANNKGRVGVARAKSIGKAAALSMLAGSVSRTVVDRTMGKGKYGTAVALGTAAVGTILQGVAVGKGINEVRAVNEAQRNRDK